MAIMQYTHNEPSFSPLDYSPIAWYDSSDISTITKDISDKVSQWNDKSGLGYHLVQTVDLNKPIYSAGNGLLFDGNNDYMVKAFGTTYSQPATFFVVFKSVINQPFWLIDGINSSNRMGIICPSGGVDLNIYAGTLLGYPKPTPYSNFIISTAVFNTSSSLIKENNVTKISGDTGANSTVGITLGCRYTTVDSFINCYIKEIIIYNSALSTDQITTVNNYLNSKYIIY